MKTQVQEEFIGKVTNESYQAFCSSLNNKLGITIPYRVCEMPIFVSHAFRKQLEEAAVSIVQQCVQPKYLERSNAAMQERYTVPNQSARPLFSVVDFAVTADNCSLTGYSPKLIELQGFPSLFGYQYLFASMMQQQYGIENATPFMGNIASEKEYIALMKAAIFAEVDPRFVALMEVDPNEQKTQSDFIAVQQLIGLQTVNIRDVIEMNLSLFIQSDTGLTPLKRIYNRAIIDELDDMEVKLGFNWSDNLNVQWAGHPNWYFRMSKYSMPYLSHDCVPRTSFLSSLDTLPKDLYQYVLKPLYSFAGKGVNVNPTEADILAIPKDQRDKWILQEKVRYSPCVPTPFGDNNVEIRVMCVWLDGMDEPRPVMSLARTGRGQLMGARYNTEPWTGSSGCLFME